MILQNTLYENGTEYIIVTNWIIFFKNNDNYYIINHNNQEILLKKKINRNYIISE